jgi:hypothetical protein
MEITMDASQTMAEGRNAAEMHVMPEPEHDPSNGENNSLETIELELALQFQDFVELGFEGSVKRAIESVGGRLLFQMRLDGAEDCDRVAAVSMKSGDGERFALVVLPADGGTPRVEAAETSSHPIAGITAAYAGLMDQLGAAA